MKRLFMIEVGHDEEKGAYLANVVSTSENKGMSVQGVSIKGVMAEVGKRVRKQTLHMRKFPLPEPGKIIGLNGGPSSLILPGVRR